MNFTPSRKTLGASEEKNYDHDLQLYREIPDFYINLDEFEEWTVERLKGKKSNISYTFFYLYYFVFMYSMLSLVLQILEQLSLKGNTSNYEDYIKSVLQEIKKEGLKHMFKLVCNLVVFKQLNLLLNFEFKGIPIYLK